MPRAVGGGSEHAGFWAALGALAGGLLFADQRHANRREFKERLYRRLGECPPVVSRAGTAYVRVSSVSFRGGTFRDSIRIGYVLEAGRPPVVDLDALERSPRRRVAFAPSGEEWVHAHVFATPGNPDHAVDEFLRVAAGKAGTVAGQTFAAVGQHVAPPAQSATV